MIEINNLTTSPIAEDLIQRVAKIVLEGENKGEVDLSLALVGQGRIRELNKKYRKKNRVTDVLSFPESRTPAKSLGEVIICLREVKKNAKKFGVDFQQELARILIHGILTLLGYEHKDSAGKMEEKEKLYLSKV